jgi:integral membrane protein (TIGR01906 family)
MLIVKESAGLGSGRRPRDAGASIAHAVATLGWRLATVCAIVAVPFVIILAAVRFAFSWQPVYTYAIVAYHADEATGLPSSQLLAATRTIRNYFTNDERDLNITVLNTDGQPQTLFNQREIAHMRDVKALVQRFYALLAIAILVVAAYAAAALLWNFGSVRGLARAALAGSILTVALVLAFGAAALLGFDQLFTEFHVLSFSNDFWQLDPATDHLVQMFPLGFWFDVSMFVGVLALAISVALAIFAGTVLLLTRGAGEVRPERGRA